MRYDERFLLRRNVPLNCLSIRLNASALSLLIALHDEPGATKCFFITLCYIQIE